MSNAIINIFIFVVMIYQRCRGVILRALGASGRSRTATIEEMMSGLAGLFDTGFFFFFFSSHLLTSGENHEIAETRIPRFVP